MTLLPRQPPSVPEGVEVVYRNGDRVACEVYYVGEQDGLHVWEATAAVDIQQIARLHVDVLPGLTSVRLKNVE